MAGKELTVETIPAEVFVEERATGRHVDFSIEIHNGGADDLELIAIEQDVYDANDALVQRRRVDETGSPIPADADHGSRIGSGERRTISNPLPGFAAGTPLAALVYRFHFRTPDGRVFQSAIRLSPIEGSARALRVPSEPPERDADEQPAPPTPRQLARAWFETLYELRVYATS